mgnify:CR=1 FL=1
MLQLLADITGRPIERAAAPQASALGAAIFAAVAAGSARGGYATVREAVARMAAGVAEVVHPDPGRWRVYARVHEVYRSLFDHFGRGGSTAMAALRALRAGARA